MASDDVCVRRRLRPTTVSCADKREPKKCLLRSLGRAFTRKLRVDAVPDVFRVQNAVLVFDTENAVTSVQRRRFSVDGAFSSVREIRSLLSNTLFTPAPGGRKLTTGVSGANVGRPRPTGRNRHSGVGSRADVIRFLPARVTREHHVYAGGEREKRTRDERKRRRVGESTFFFFLIPNPFFGVAPAEPVVPRHAYGQTTSRGRERTERRRRKIYAFRPTRVHASRVPRNDAARCGTNVRACPERAFSGIALAGNGKILVRLTCVTVHPRPVHDAPRALERRFYRRTQTFRLTFLHCVYDANFTYKRRSVVVYVIGIFLFPKKTNPPPRIQITRTVRFVVVVVVRRRVTDDDGDGSHATAVQTSSTKTKQCC